MQDIYDDLRVLRDRMEELNQKIESRIQDDTGSSSTKSESGRLVKFPLGGIGGGQTAKVDWLGSSGWVTGSKQITVVYRGPSTTVVGQGTDPRTGTNRTGYVLWCQQTGTWDVIQEFC